MSAENAKQGTVQRYLTQSIGILNVNKNTVDSRGMALARRIEEIEKMIGVRACVDETTGRSIY